MEISPPQRDQATWSFEFLVETEGAIDSEFLSLYRDCRGVPMIPTDESSEQSLLCVEGPKQNIWFELVNNVTGDNYA